MPVSIIGVSVACGLVIDTLLVVNNYRDIDNDWRAGKRTLIVKIGAANGRRLYLWLGIAACAINMAFSYWPAVWSWLLPMLYLPFHVAAYRAMVRIDKGAELNRVLGMTARNMLLYGLFSVIGLIAGMFVVSH